MARPLALLLTAALLAGCGGLGNLRFPGVYRVTIQQGNVLTQDMVDRLKPGMSRRQVRFVLGEPILENAFRADRWDYVYTVQVGGNPRQQQRLTLWFEEDALVSFEGDFAPSPVLDSDGEAPEDGAENEARPRPILPGINQQTGA